MQITVDPDARLPVYRQIVSQLRRAIAVGEISPGDSLPPVRQLAEDVGVNFNTVAKAYRTLAAEGLVATHQGRGVRVIVREKPQINEGEVSVALERFLSEMMLAGMSDAQIIGLVRQALETMKRPALKDDGA